MYTTIKLFLGIIMIEVKQVNSKKDVKTFVDFPTKLYKGVKEYSYPLRMDELNMFNPKKNLAYKDCDVVMFLAYKDGKVVGRIAGIVQKLYNKKVNEKRVRFTRFDAINDVDVAKALFNAVENWAKQKGMNTVHGPLGFNDLDCEGLIVEGFDERCTFEERYNFEYYKDLIYACGYEKEIDWLERKIYPPKQTNERVERIANIVAKRHKLRFATAKSKSEFIKKYKDGILDVLDKAYSPLYGVVPYTEDAKKQLITQFKMFLDLRFMFVIVNDKDEVVSFGVAIPQLNEAVYKSKGRLTIPTLFRVLKALKSPKVVDFAIIGVRPDYANEGVGALAIKFLMDNMKKEGVKYCETNVCLENNAKINSTWEYFEHTQHRRRRAFVKQIF